MLNGLLVYSFGNVSHFSKRLVFVMAGPLLYRDPAVLVQAAVVTLHQLLRNCIDKSIFAIHEGHVVRNECVDWSREAFEFGRFLEHCALFYKILRHCAVAADPI